MAIRATSLLTLAATTAALVLSFLVLFAGNNPSFIQQADILTLNTSRLGYGKAFFNTTDGNPKNPFTSIINGIEGDLNNAFSSAAHDLAKELNISDYYNVHVMNYCKGFYEPNATVAVNGTPVSRNTTFCSKTNAFFHFNITDNIVKSLPSKVTLNDIHWPSAITDAEHSIRLTSMVMSILYIISVCLVGLSFLVALFGMFSKGGGGRLNACVDLMINTLAFLALGAASAVATVLMVKAVTYLNKYGKNIGISATMGKTFLAMTWSATGLMLLAMVLGITHFVRGRRNNYVSEKAGY